jgi:NADH-quinone oxidoreductase subunit L
MEEADHIFEVNAGEYLHSAPVGGGEAFWAMLSFGIAVTVIVLSTIWLGRQDRKRAVDTPAYRGFAKVLYNKWYVDEIYQAGIISPLVRMSRGAWRYIDEGIIDRTVNGAGGLARGLGWMGSRLHTGNLNVYALAIVVGALLILLRVVGL